MSSPPSSLVHHETPSFQRAHADERGPKVGIGLNLASAQRVLARHLPGVVCDSLSLFVRGYNNRTYTLHCTRPFGDDGGASSGGRAQFELILRLSGRYWDRRKTESEVAALVYLRHHRPDVPVPLVLFYGVDTDLLGTCYIGLERMRGRPLDEAWPDMSHVKRMRAVECLAEHVAVIRQMAFDRIGNFCIRSGEVNHEESGSILPSIDDIFIGELVDGERGRGPFSKYRDHVRSGLETNLNHFLNHAIFKSSVPLLEERLKRFLQSSFLSPTSEGSTIESTELSRALLEQEPKFLLTHYDLEPRNFLVDDASGELTAILDWEFAGSFPEHEEWMISFEFLQANSAENMYAALTEVEESRRPETEVASSEVRETEPGSGAVDESGSERRDALRSHFLARLEQLGCATPRSGDEAENLHRTRTELHLLVDNVAPWFLLDADQNLPENADEELAKSAMVVDKILAKFGF